ncbi:conserved Plasmodium protein, unknown function [Plasmodium relictum]|uniref:Uncharacterized protein n=1 Tax=Plasmodium relictum TaxID=85471 RepID=A0A1J1H490_PLARL|nr:conserved Plasmodium protein, unknown function [Plasmodium relictum]CRG99504.1 conserved Plasmodium protein, unknown function [Plasmodium relictum]
MEELKEIIYKLKKLKKNLNNKVTNMNYGDYMINNHYIEKKIVYILYQIIKSYYYLLTLYGKRSKKKKRKKENKIKDKGRNKNKKYINEEIILKKLKRKKIIQNRYTKKIKDFLKSNKSINIFKNYVEKKYLKQHINCDNKKKRKILINIETNIYFNNFIAHIINFLYFIFQNDINNENFKNDYSNNKLRNEVHKLYKNSNFSNYNIINKESIQGNKHVSIINKKNKEVEDIYTIFKEKIPNKNNKLLKEYSFFKEENIIKKDNLKIANTSNKEITCNDLDVIKHPIKKQEKDDNKNSDENYFFFHLYKKNMYLINKNIESYYYYYNSFIIRSIDSNLLYIIDNDMNLLKILFYFDVVNLFVIYLFIINCKNQEMCKYLSIFLIINIKFRRNFKLYFNKLLENKNIPILFYVFSNILKKNIFKANNKNNENKLMVSINNNVSNDSLYNTTSLKKNNLYLKMNLKEFYIMKTTNDIKEINRIKKKNNTFLFLYKNSEYNNDERSSLLISDHNNINKKVNKIINIYDKTKDKNKKNEYINKSRISHTSDEEILKFSKSKNEKKEKQFSYENLFNYFNTIKNTSNEKNDYYYYYSLIKDENEIDSVNLTLSVNNTKDENIFFYKSYIIEHIYNLFLNKYNLKLKKNTYVSNETKKENNTSLFDNYKKLFHNFFFIKNIL